MKISNKKQTLAVLVAVLLSVTLVAVAVYASTTIGNNVSVGGTLSVTGTSSLAKAEIGGATNYIQIGSGGVLTMEGSATIDGVGSGNLVDKSAAETITGGWTFSTATTTFSKDIQLGSVPLYFANAQIYYVDSSGNAKFNDLDVAGTTTLATTTISDLTVTGTSTLATTTVPLLKNPSANLSFQSTSNYIDSSGNLVIAGTIDTGQGATEVYGMDQAVKTSSDVTFNNLNLSGTSTLATTTIGGGTAISKHLSTTATIDFPAIGTSTCSTATSSLSGVAVGDTVIASPQATAGGIETLNMSWNGFASTTDAVGVRACSFGSAQDPPSQTWRFDVWQH